MIEVEGVQWCVTHSGILDECADDRADDDGNPRCDMYDVSEACHAVTLYVDADEAQR